MRVAVALAVLVAELADEIPDPLAQPFTLAALWSDLARIAGEEPPADVAALLETPIAGAAD